MGSRMSDRICTLALAERLLSPSRVACVLHRWPAWIATLAIVTCHLSSTVTVTVARPSRRTMCDDVGFPWRVLQSPLGRRSFSCGTPYDSIV
ncbi:hypothetical protein EXIGLDRAFT_473764 [Exidia glandulosa HHB12029]|uniref:Uncharacterized protein n=1 Tax=Exidia glandulosa HHB12029 TaxID=1314781 RepID=A0A165ARZ3_EXIGL|nr:hypothetical protein EXIGLDRAFT_473764 [Exidia glandulosa HHB12029]